MVLKCGPKTLELSEILGCQAKMAAFPFIWRELEYSRKSEKIGNGVAECQIVISSNSLCKRA
jgi:hypothetical protein